MLSPWCNAVVIHISYTIWWCQPLGNDLIGRTKLGQTNIHLCKWTRCQKPSIPISCGKRHNGLEISTTDLIQTIVFNEVETTRMYRRICHQIVVGHKSRTPIISPPTDVQWIGVGPKKLAGDSRPLSRRRTPNSPPEICPPKIRRKNYGTPN